MSITIVFPVPVKKTPTKSDNQTKTETRDIIDKTQTQWRVFRLNMLLTNITEDIVAFRRFGF